MHQDLAPGFLIASPKLDNTPFERAVIAMVHQDDDGAMGFIVNKPLEIDFGALLRSAARSAMDNVHVSASQMTVHFGGPVRVEQLWVLAHDLDDDAPSADVRVEPDWSLIAQAESIEALATGASGLNFRPFVGYTGWDNGQLEREIEEGSWLFLEFNDDYILSTDHETMWEDALKRLGVAPMAFLMMANAAQT